MTHRNPHEQSRLALAVVIVALVAISVIVALKAREQPAEPAPQPRLVVAAVDPAPAISAALVAAEAARVEAEQAAAQIAAESAQRRAAVDRRRPSRSKRTAQPSRSGAHRGYATWHDCTAAVENGGDYGRSSNRSHFGRYQFSRATWRQFGGNPDTWGHASAEEQDRVFANAVAAGAERHWRPYNGC